MPSLKEAQLYLSDPRLFLSLVMGLSGTYYIRIDDLSVVMQEPTETDIIIFTDGSVVWNLRSI